MEKSHPPGTLTPLSGSSLIAPHSVTRASAFRPSGSSPPPTPSGLSMPIATTLLTSRMASRLPPSLMKISLSRVATPQSSALHGEGAATRRIVLSETAARETGAETAADVVPTLSSALLTGLSRPPSRQRELPDRPSALQERLTKLSR